MLLLYYNDGLIALDKDDTCDENTPYNRQLIVLDSSNSHNDSTATSHPGIHIF